MTCLRHSYAKGSIKGQRQCRKCKEWDGEAPKPAFDLSEFLGGAPEKTSAVSLPESGATAIPASEPVSPGDASSPLAETPCIDFGTGVPGEANPGTPAPTPLPVVEPGTVCPSPPVVVPAPGPTETGCADDCCHPSHGHKPWSFPGSMSYGKSPAALAEQKIANLPAHSSLGASSAERWMECPGSVELIRYLDGFESDDPDYRSEGVLAHEIAAHCLTEECDAWEAMAKFPGARQEMCNAVQVYLDYVSSRPGRREVEVKLHRPELHPAMFGTIDCKLVPTAGQDKLVLEIVDYKNGAGIFVSAVENKQMRYYAALEIYRDADWYPDDGEVRLTIVQPNCYTDEGPVRTWTTTVGAIKEWVQVDLLPSMIRASAENYLSLGEWCRFCPAKLACPAMGERASEMRKHAAELLTADDNSPLKELSEEVFGRIYVDAQPIRMLLKALDAEAYRRLTDRRAVPGVKLVQKRVDRVWKAETDVETQTGVVEITIEEAAKDRFGNDAWVTKLRSPAQMEALPGGKGFVAEWAYKPEAGYTVALESDSRAGVVPKSGEQLHSPAIQKYLDSVSE